MKLELAPIDAPEEKKQARRDFEHAQRQLTSALDFIEQGVYCSLEIDLKTLRAEVKRLHELLKSFGCGLF